ncbi:MAG: type II toxin-antitoxin system RelE/ParE family toxin [Patescibacteria group bacterium]
MVTFAFTQKAKKVFYKLPQTIQERVLEKLKELKNNDDILSVVKRLSDFKYATHRLRIGMYRLILQLKEHTSDYVEFWIVDIGHRKDIYK